MSRSGPAELVSGALDIRGGGLRGRDYNNQQPTNGDVRELIFEEVIGIMKHDQEEEAPDALFYIGNETKKHLDFESLDMIFEEPPL